MRENTGENYMTINIIICSSLVKMFKCGGVRWKRFIAAPATPQGRTGGIQVSHPF
jgi:hypothetical protein